MKGHMCSDRSTGHVPQTMNLKATACGCRAVAVSVLGLGFPEESCHSCHSCPAMAFAYESQTSVLFKLLLPGGFSYSRLDRNSIHTGRDRKEPKANENI